MAQVSRLEKKLAVCLENKEYYEAHQVYRTMYFRMVTASKFDELLTLLYTGTLTFLSVDEVQSGMDLADLYADTLVKGHCSPSEEIYNKLTKLLSEICEKTPATDSSGRNSVLDARNKFVSDCILWSRSFSSKKREQVRGLSELHHKIAMTFWKAEDYEAARSHMLLAENPEDFSALLIEMHRELGHPSEIDLFITLAVLQLLCLHRVKSAGELFSCYLRKHPELGLSEPPYRLPLLNFCHQLIRILPRRNISSFTLLLEKYQESLNRDPSYAAYLRKISHLFMNVPEQRGGGLLGNLFKGLMGDEKQEEEVFSDSDMDEDLTMEHDGDDDGFTTADEEELPVVEKPKAPVVDQMDDLD